jgi:hypothetical protein
MQQQHVDCNSADVDCKIADALLKRGTKQHADGRDTSSKAWARMVLHLPHAEGGFGVTFNDITKDAAFYTTSRFVAWLGAFSQERQGLWLPKDDLQDSCSWSSPALVLLRDIHSKLLTHYDCKEGCAPSQSPPHVGARGGHSSQDVSHQQEAAPLFLPQLDRLRHSCGERTLPMLQSPPSRLRIGLHSRSVNTGSRLKTSSRHLQSRVVPSSLAFARSSASSPLLKTRSCGQRW